MRGTTERSELRSRGARVDWTASSKGNPTSAREADVDADAVFHDLIRVLISAPQGGVQHGSVP